MNYFLVKTDPDTYSIEDFKNEKETVWDGVHNFQAINFIKKMQVGDQIYFYHSQKEKAVLGLAEVSGEAFKNENDPRTSWAIKLTFVKEFSTPLSLADIKSEPANKDFLLLRNPRLSVMEVPATVASWMNQRLG